GPLSSALLTYPTLFRPRAGDRGEVHQDRLTRRSDGRDRREPLPVDGDRLRARRPERVDQSLEITIEDPAGILTRFPGHRIGRGLDRKSTRLNSSHVKIS